MLGVCDKSGNETSPESLDANDDLAFLRRTKPPVPASTGRFNVVDLFSGCGGMTIGALEAARRKGIDAGVELAVDLETEPLDVFRETLGLSEISVLRHDLSELVSDSKSQGRKVLVDRLHAVQAPTFDGKSSIPCPEHATKRTLCVELADARHAPFHREALMYGPVRHERARGVSLQEKYGSIR